MAVLQPRYDRECYYDRYGNPYNCTRTAWNDWVRWVVLAVIVVGFFLLFVLCSCLTARRRRKAGRNPFYGTGWAARPPPAYTPNAPANNQYAPPPPQYGANQGYYGGQQPQYGQPQYGQQQGVELQSPQPTYNRDPENVYQPPPGPPPGKTVY